VYRRVAQAGDHRNNVSQGGDKQYLPVDAIPKEAIELAVRASQVLGRDICGADIMLHQQTGTPVVLEANFNFGIRALPGIVSEELHGLARYLHHRANS
jgi:glutathione synthase/RimK-type ligase-like ATP-grasp enzyme